MSSTLLKTACWIALCLLSSVQTANAKASTAFRDEVDGVHVSLATSFMDRQACGFMNQHMKLLVLLSMAIYMRVDEVVVPMAVFRKAYEHQTLWRPALSSSLWDMDSISRLLLQHGVAMAVADRNRPKDGSMSLPSYFLKVLPLPDMDRDVRAAVRQQWANLTVKPARLRLWAPDLMLALQTWDSTLYAQVAAAVAWAPNLLKLAAASRAQLAGLGGTQGRYNGLHLRVEGDVIKLDVVDSHLAQYAEMMANMSYGGAGGTGAGVGSLSSRPPPPLPLYVGSGVFDGKDADPELFAKVEAWFQRDVVGRGLASRVVHRRTLRARRPRTWGIGFSGIEHLGEKQGQRKKLHSEQRALVDFLVLCGAEKAVGTWYSSFSFGLREWRALMMGRPRSSTLLGFKDVSGRFNRGLGVQVGPDVVTPEPLPT